MPIAFLTFSVRQYQVLLITMANVQVIAESVAALACLYLLNRPRWVAAKFLAAVFFAVLSSYTMGQGLPVWPVGLVPLLLSPLSRRSKIALTASWCAIAGVVLFFYFWGWTNGPGHFQISMVTYQYFATIVGGAVFPELLAAMIGGAILVLLCAAAIALSLAFGKARQYSFWLAIMLYGFVVDAQITAGRGAYTGFGPAQALSSRYAVHAILTVVGLYAILSSLNYEKVNRFIAALWVPCSGWSSWASYCPASMATRSRPTSSNSGTTMCSSSLQPIPSRMRLCRRPLGKRARRCDRTSYS